MGVYLHLRTRTSLFHILQTAERIMFKFGVWLGTHSMSLTHVRCGTHLHVRTCTSPFARQCLRGRSFIADQGALLVWQYCLTYVGSRCSIQHMPWTGSEDYRLRPISERAWLNSWHKQCDRNVCRLDSDSKWSAKILSQLDSDSKCITQELSQLDSDSRSTTIFLSR